MVKLTLEMMFGDVLKWNQSYQNNFEESKNWHGFGPKPAIFSTFIFRQYRPQKITFTVF